MAHVLEEYDTLCNIHHLEASECQQGLPATEWDSEKYATGRQTLFSIWEKINTNQLNPNLIYALGWIIKLL